MPIQTLQGTVAKPAATELGRYAVIERVQGKSFMRLSGRLNA